MSYHVNPYFHTLLSPDFFLHAKFVILKVLKSEDQMQKLNKGFKKGCQEHCFSSVGHST
jgi:hypothetical protein